MNRRATATTLSVCLLLLVANAAVAGVDVEHALERVHELRAQARYAEAYEAADELRVAVEREQSPDWHIEDVQSEVETIGLVLNLPEAARAALARADELTEQITRFTYQWNFVDALVAAVEQLAIREKYLGSDHPETAASHHSVAVLLYAGNRIAIAAEQFRYVVTLRRRILGHNHPDLAESIIQEARTRRLLEGNDAATPLLNEARAIVDATVGPDHLTRAALFHALGVTYRLQGKQDEIEHYYREALRIRVARLGASHPIAIDNLCWLAHLVREFGRIEESVELLEEARRLSLVSGWGRPGVYRTIITALGNQTARLKNNEKAETYLRESFELSREALVTTPAWFGVRERVPDAHRVLTKMLLDAGRSDEAWETLASASGWHTTLFGLRQQRDTWDDDLRRRWHDARRRALNAERRVTIAVRRAGDDPDRLLATAPARLRCLQADVALMRIEREVLTTADRAVADAPRLGDLQAALRPGEAVVGWFEWAHYVDRRVGDGDYRLYGYVIRHDGSCRWVELMAGTKREEWNELNAPTTDAVRSIHDVSIWPQRVPPDNVLRALSHDAWQKRFAQLLPYLDGVDKLYVDEHHLWRGLPLECLVDDAGEYLMDRFVVSYVSSFKRFISGASHPRAEDTVADRPALVVGDPNYAEPSVASADGEDLWAMIDTPRREILDRTTIRGVLENGAAVEDLPRLPMSGEEAHRIAAMFDNARVLTGADAREAVLDEVQEQGMEKYGMLHFATHALVHPRVAEWSALVVTPGKGGKADEPGADMYDGLVTTREIQLGWDLDADIVTLSGCQTGRGPMNLQRETLGFHQVLLASGAKSVVTSLWEVDDAATALLMIHFYEELRAARADGVSAPADRSTKARALADAKRWLRNLTDRNGRRPFAHPAYWAGFILIGDPN